MCQCSFVDFDPHVSYLFSSDTRHTLISRKTLRYPGYERVYLSFGKVAAKPFHIQGDDLSVN